jgi:hypothetical protein
MKRLLQTVAAVCLLALILSSPATAQYTPAFPGSVVAQSQIYKICDGAFSQLAADINNSQTSFQVKGGESARFCVDQLIVVESEMMRVTGINPADTLVVVRHVEGTVAASHTRDRYVSGYIFGANHNNLALELIAVEQNVPVKGTATPGQCAVWNANSKTLDSIPCSSGAVSTVFSRSGTVTAQSGDYNAGQVTNTPAGNIAASTVQAAINELDTEKSAVGHSHAASAITNTPSGNIAAVTVQGAINELDSEKQPVDTGLTALSSLGGAPCYAKLTGVDTWTCDNPAGAGDVTQAGNNTYTGYNNFSGGRIRPPEATFATPPAVPLTGQEWTFTDASAAGVCSGGGTALAKCRWNGASWDPIGGGGGPGGGLSTIKAGGTTVSSSAVSLDFLPGFGLLSALVDTGGGVVTHQASANSAVLLTRAANQAGDDLYLKGTSASGTAYVVSPQGNALAAYQEGQSFNWKPDVDCTGGATTIQIGTLAAKSLTKADGTNPSAGDCAVASGPYRIVYDGTKFKLPAAGGGTGAPTTASYLTATAEAGLSAESNLGALSSGVVKISVAGGVATPSVVSGTATDCIKVNGSSGACGGGSSKSFQLHAPDYSNTLPCANGVSTAFTHTIPANTLAPGDVVRFSAFIVAPNIAFENISLKPNWGGVDMFQVATQSDSSGVYRWDLVVLTNTTYALFGGLNKSNGSFNMLTQENTLGANVTGSITYDVQYNCPVTGDPFTMIHVAQVIKP